jgi:hypothetical protein
MGQLEIDESQYALNNRLDEESFKEILDILRSNIK